MMELNDIISFEYFLYFFRIVLSKIEKLFFLPIKTKTLLINSNKTILTYVYNSSDF